MEKAEVLVIEDDADIREGVRILLESEGYFVRKQKMARPGFGYVKKSEKILCPNTVSDCKSAGIG